MLTHTVKPTEHWSDNNEQSNWALNVTNIPFDFIKVATEIKVTKRYEITSTCIEVWSQYLQWTSLQLWKSAAVEINRLFLKWVDHTNVIFYPDWEPNFTNHRNYIKIGLLQCSITGIHHISERKFYTSFTYIILFVCLLVVMVCEVNKTFNSNKKVWITICLHL